jgi:O-antigen/teichoic acid export membrane protein
MDGGVDRPVPGGEIALASVPDGQQAGGAGWWVRTGAGRKLAPWARLLGTDSGQHTLALIDQAVVSGTSFVTTILIGRWCGAGELGVYSLGFSLLVSWGCMQQSLIALPYTIYRHRSQWGTQEEYAGSALVHNGMLSVLAFVALAVGAVALSLGGGLAGLAAVTWALAGVMPFALLREFGRRFAFAHLRMAQALVLDVAVAAVQLPGLAWLASTGRLSGPTAFVAFGGACALTSGIWLYLERQNFAIRWDKVRKTMQQSWALGRWLFASQLTVWLQAYFVHWLLACLLGAMATGVYAACMTVVLFSNPLLLGISNALAPRAAQAFAEGGGPRLRRVVLQTTLLLGAAMALFCAVVMLAGEDIMALLYHGQQYEGYGNTVTVLALAMLAAALGMPASNGLAAAERPDLSFKAGLLAISLSVILVPCLVIWWGVGGAAFGFLVGHVAGSMGRWVGFSAVLRQRGKNEGEWENERVEANSMNGAASLAGSPSTTLPDSPFAMESDGEGISASVIRVLQQFTQSSESEAWVIEQLNEGAQASIFVVRRRDGRPIWQTHSNVAVKLYKPAAWQSVEVVHGQFDSLSQLYARLNDSTISGWKIYSPDPLYQCERPLALVMTMVPGRSLNSFLETADQVTIAELESIAHAVGAALERYWLIDSQLHGDLNFDNILCDVVARSLSFVDPGVVENTALCNGVSRDWYPASRDLAYLLFDTSVSLKKTIGNPAARRRQEWLLERVLRAFMKGIVPAGKKHCLLDEIQACVQMQLKGLRVSWSPRGMWRLFLKRTASRRIGLILGRLRADAGP